MLKAIDVANFFVDLASSMEEEFMTNLKVNKLVYFAQAWSLVRLNRELFSEDVVAWTYGPVIPSVYDAFRPCGRNKIEHVCGEYTQAKFSSEELDLLVDVALQYGQYTAPTLVNITHKPKSPWSQVYKEHENNIITKESMREYFSALKPLPTFNPAFDENDFVGYRDSEGFLVLPKEWDDDDN